jgi:hypothetical protein
MPTLRATPGFAILALSATALWTGTARAQGGDPSATAEALFRSGRELMASGHLDEACPKFAESQRIDPKIGTLMNLALCHEKAGLTASAWAEYAEAGTIAHRLGQLERERVAQERSKALEAALVHVVIDVSAPAETQVTLDGQPIEAGGFGTPIPVDPGDHVVAANAAGKKTFRDAFHLAARTPDHTTRVPVLEAEAPAPLPPVVAHVDEAPAAPPPPAGHRTLGLVIGGAGIVVVGVGAFFGFHAFSEKHTAENECDAAFCTQAGLDAISSMKASEAVSTIAIATGVAAIGVGTYLVVSAGHGPQVGIGPAGRGMRLSVSW